MPAAVGKSAVPITAYPPTVITPASAQAIVAGGVQAHPVPVEYFIQQQQAPFVLFSTAGSPTIGNAGDYVVVNSVTGAMSLVLAVDFSANWIMG